MQAEFLTNNLMLTWYFTFMSGLILLIMLMAFVHIFSQTDWWKNEGWLKKIRQKQVFTWGVIVVFFYALFVAISLGTTKVVIDNDIQTPPRVESIGEVKDTSKQNKTFEERENEIVDSFTDGNFNEEGKEN